MRIFIYFFEKNCVFLFALILRIVLMQSKDKFEASQYVFLKSLGKVRLG